MVAITPITNYPQTTALGRWVWPDPAGLFDGPIVVLLVGGNTVWRSYVVMPSAWGGGVDVSRMVDDWQDKMTSEAFAADTQLGITITEAIILERHARALHEMHSKDVDNLIALIPIRDKKS